MSKEQLPVDPCYEVVWPLAPRAAAQVTMAPGLEDLNGKTIAELWDGVFRGDQVFPILREELKKRYPGLRIIEHTELGITYGNVPDYMSRLPALLKKAGCDAVISGVGA